MIEDPAIDHHDLRGHEAGLVAGQKRHGLGDVLGLAQEWRQLVLLDPAQLLGRVAEADVGSHDQPRRDHVAANALLAVLGRGVQRQTVDRGFRGGIGRTEQVAAQGRARTRVDDRSAAAFKHQRDRVLDHQHRSAGVDGEGLVPDVDRHFREGHVARHLLLAGVGSIVVQHVEPPVRLRNGSVERSDAVFVRYVDLPRLGLAASGGDVADDGSGVIDRHVADDHHRPHCRQPAGTGFADAARAGHDGHASCQFLHVPLPLLHCCVPEIIRRLSRHLLRPSPHCNRDRPVSRSRRRRPGCSHRS